VVVGLADTELGKDFLLARADERVGSVINRLLQRGGNDYSFILVRIETKVFQACQLGKLKQRLKTIPPNDFFMKRLVDFSVDFVEVPSIQQAETNLAEARKLVQQNPLRFLVVLREEEVAGYFWLVSRTVYPGKPLGDVFKAFLDQHPGENQFVHESMKSAEPHSRKNVVNTGFTNRDAPGILLPKEKPLSPGADYFFCLGVGEYVAGSIEATPTSLPENLPKDALLQVVVFAFEGELALDPQGSLGLLKLQEDGSAAIVRQPGSPSNPPEVPWLLFPVKAPPQTGLMRLRCNIYYNQCLVQSRLVSAQVYPVGQWSGNGPALLSELDYTLSQSMSAAHLAGIQAHRLSLMINDNGNGTHGFRFFGEGEFKSDVTIDAQQVQGLIEYARAAFRKTAWGEEKAHADQPYRYAGPPDLKRLREDLISLAIRGYRIYDQMINLLAGGRAQARQLSEIMDHPGLVQIALKQSARFVLPAALIYDYPLDTGADAKDFQLCPQFLDALKGSDPLEKCACFEGNCPSREDEVTICPSGFWGFRHALGLPLSLVDAPDAPTEISVKDRPSCVMSVCLDPNFTQRSAHETRLRNMLTQVEWTRADNRETTFDALKLAKPHLVYFYCHGGLTSSNIPFIQVGQMTERGITRDNLRAKDVFWEDPRPLVFINGCHTTALEPDSAFELVSGFVEVAGAAGVIGTEITIFEPLATSFAENFLQSFSQGMEVGEAIRRSRLALLKQSNPLGLVYIPYAMAGLHITKK
jgi:hypothetical protein